MQMTMKQEVGWHRVCPKMAVAGGHASFTLAGGERKDRGTAMSAGASSGKKTKKKKMNNPTYTQMRTGTTGHKAEQDLGCKTADGGADRLEGHNGGRTCGVRNRREITWGVRGGDWGKE